MATMLCQLFAADPQRALPHGRSSVFQAFVDLLNRRQYSDANSGLSQQIKAVLSPYGQRAEHAGERLMEQAMSLIGQVASAWQGGSAQAAADLLGEWTAGLRPSHVPATAWMSLVREVLRRSGVLVERGGDFAFLHQTIAEYLAAQYVLTDPQRNDEEFHRLFRPGSWKVSDASSPLWQQSYGRFCAAGWQDRPDLSEALTGLAGKGGIAGARFVAALVSDGLRLAPEVVEHTLACLVRLAKDQALPELDRRSAVTYVRELDSGRSAGMLAAAVEDRAFELAYRRWALQTLAEVRKHSSDLTAQRDVQWAMTVLAEFDDRHGADLIAKLAKDFSLAGIERRWAAEALLAAGDRRGGSQLVKLAKDPYVHSSERELAAKALNAAGDPRGQQLLAALEPADEEEPQAHRRGRIRGRLARLGPSRLAHANPVLEPMLRLVRAIHPKADLVLIEKAYRTAEKWHKGQTRKSGDPYITHSVVVATILAELGMTPPTLCAALLHAALEGTPYTLEELRGDFGDEIAYLVDGVTKLDKVKYGQHAQAETIRKMVIAMARDIRVLVIKLADRLHNMRTLRYLEQAKQVRIAQETLDIYAPLANRLGMNTLKWELEDLAFATLQPKLYDEIVRQVADRAPSRDELLRRVIDQIADDLAAAKIQATVNPQPKHYYSVYQEMIAKGGEFSDIYELVGIRLITDSVRDCYAALGVLHGVWNPVPGRFKDYIAMPAFGIYQSLETALRGPAGKPVEVQILTASMHRRAEYGVAAHWRHKDWPAGSEPGALPWLRQLVDWQRETADPQEFLDSLRDEMGSGQIYVYTPKGDVLDLPEGSTPIDFAYAIHTDVGHRCVGARVNGRLVPLESKLDNGDLVDLLTSKAENAGPSRDWQDIVQSPKAKNKIRQWFTKDGREDAIEHGEELLTRMVRKEGLPLQRALADDAVAAVAEELNLPDVAALYVALGEGNIPVQSVLHRLVESLGLVAEAEEVDDEGRSEAVLDLRLRETSVRGDPGVMVKDADDVWVKLARCCTPVPGDPIVGFVTRGEGVSVHRNDCSNMDHLRQQPERVVEVQWSPTAQSLFLVAIQVEALDHARLLSDVTRELSNQHVHVRSASVVTTRDRVCKSRFTFEMADPKHLGHVLRAVRGVEGVFDVYRITTTS